MRPQGGSPPKMKVSAPYLRGGPPKRKFPHLMRRQGGKQKMKYSATYATSRWQTKNNGSFPHLMRPQGGKPKKKKLPHLMRPQGGKPPQNESFRTLCDLRVANKHHAISEGKKWKFSAPYATSRWQTQKMKVSAPCATSGWQTNNGTMCLGISGKKMKKKECL